MEKVVTYTNIDELLGGDQPVLIDFWATWCGPCKAIAPVIESLAEEFEGQVVIGKCDVDEAFDLPVKFGVRNIPTVIFLKGGELVDKQVGAAQRSVYEEKIKALL